MSNTVHAFDFLAAPGDKYPPEAVCVAFGDEPFLKRLVVGRWRDAVLGGDDSDVPFTSFDGNSAEWRDVHDEVATVALFGGGRRLVVVDQADDLVTKSRKSLEDYVAQPAAGGVLILDVGTWPANTRLYKAVDQTGLQVECRAPQKTVGRSKKKVLDEERLAKWLTAWSKSHHGAVLDSQAADLLLELVGPEFGLLDQELAKLALYVDPGGKITPELVRDVAGGWRTKTAWDIVDQAVEGNADEALRLLDRLLQSGEKPQAVFGQIAWSLRKFATATRIYQQAERSGRRIPIPAALEQAGFYKWPKEIILDAERRLRKLGRDRAGMLYRWLLDTDLAM